MRDCAKQSIAPCYADCLHALIPRLRRDLPQRGRLEAAEPFLHTIPHNHFFKGDFMKTVLRFLKPYKTRILLVILCMAAEAAG